MRLIILFSTRYLFKFILALFLATLVNFCYSSFDKNTKFPPPPRTYD